MRETSVSRDGNGEEGTVHEKTQLWTEVIGSEGYVMSFIV